MQPLSRNQRPKLLTSLMNMSLVLRLPREIHLCKSSANLPRLPSFLDMLQNPHGLLTFGKVQNPLRLPRKTTPEPSKVVEHALLLTFWLWNVLRATTACTFSTSQLPKVVWTWCFVHVDFEMCFAPYRRALFQYLNFQKCSEPLSFLHFWLRNALRATTACTFSTSQPPKVVRTLCALHILTWKCASRHNSVQLFMSHFTTWLHTRRFSEPTFRPSGARNHWKNTVFRDFPTFSRTCVFFLLTLSLSLTLPTSAFPSVHIVGSLTSKLPSVILGIWIQDSRFKSQKKLLQSNLFGFKIQGWRPSDSGVFFGILNLESYPLGFKNFWGYLESDVLREGWDGTKIAKKNAIFDHQKMRLSFRVQNDQNVKKNTINTTKFAWNVGLAGVIYIYIYAHIYTSV